MDMERFDSMDVARDSLHGFWNKLPDYDAQGARDHVALCFVREAGSLLWAEAHPFVAVDAQVWGETYPHEAAFLRKLGYKYLKHSSDTLACDIFPDDWIKYALEGSGIFIDECEIKPASWRLGATSKAAAIRAAVAIEETKGMKERRMPCAPSKAVAPSKKRRIEGKNVAAGLGIEETKGMKECTTPCVPSKAPGPALLRVVARPSKKAGLKE